MRRKYTAQRPLEVWRSRDGWEWRVLKKSKRFAGHPAETWYCYVVSPHAPEGEYGDVYVRDITGGTENHLPADLVVEGVAEL